MAISLVVGTNTYISLEDADEYFETRLYSDTWDESVDDDKSKALIMATKRIDNLTLRGIKAIETQTLQMPRAFYAYQPNLIYPNNLTVFRDNNWIMEREVCQNVKDAVCEEAFAILKRGDNANKRAELQNQGVKSYSIGNLSETFVTGNSNQNRLLSSEAKQLLRKYISGSAVVV